MFMPYLYDYDVVCCITKAPLFLSIHNDTIFFNKNSLYYNVNELTAIVKNKEELNNPSNVESAFNQDWSFRAFEKEVGYLIYIGIKQYNENRILKIPCHDNQSKCNPERDCDVLCKIYPSEYDKTKLLNFTLNQLHINNFAIQPSLYVEKWQGMIMPSLKDYSREIERNQKYKLIYQEVKRIYKETGYIVFNFSDYNSFAIIKNNVNDNDENLEFIARVTKFHKILHYKLDKSHNIYKEIIEDIKIPRHLSEHTIKLRQDLDGSLNDNNEFITMMAKYVMSIFILEALLTIEFIEQFRKTNLFNAVIERISDQISENLNKEIYFPRGFDSKKIAEIWLNCYEQMMSKENNVPTKETRKNCRPFHLN